MDSYFKNLYKGEFANDWSKILREEVTKEVQNTKDAKLLTTKTRKFLWDMCRKFSDDRDGTPGVACRMAEAYFLTQVQMHKTLSDAGKRQLKKKILEEFMLTILCCVFVALKLTGRKNDTISCTVVRLYLRRFGFVATPRTILMKEFEILQSMDFRPPLWTGVETAVVIGMGAGMDNHLTYIALAMDLAEYNLYDINLVINEITFSTSLLGPTQLAAGVVAAVAQRERLDVNHVSSTVASFCGIPVKFIKIIKNVLILRLPRDLAH